MTVHIIGYHYIRGRGRGRPHPPSVGSVCDCVLFFYKWFPVTIYLIFQSYSITVVVLACDSTVYDGDGVYVLRYDDCIITTTAIENSCGPLFFEVVALRPCITTFFSTIVHYTIYYFLSM